MRFIIDSVISCLFTCFLSIPSYHKFDIFQVSVVNQCLVLVTAEKMVSVHLYNIQYSLKIINKY